MSDILTSTGGLMQDHTNPRQPGKRLSCWEDSTKSTALCSIASCRTHSGKKRRILYSSPWLGMFSSIRPYPYSLSQVPSC